MRWFEKIIAVHTAVTDAVSHAQRIKSERYFVWQEEGANDFEAGNQHAERTITGSTDLFTKQEFDPWKDDFETSLNNNEIAWFLSICRQSKKIPVKLLELACMKWQML